MAEVRQGGGWRKGTESTLWVVASCDGPWAYLGAWVRSAVDGEPERVEKRVALEVLRNGREGWAQVDDEEVFGPALGEQQQLTPEPPTPPVAAAGEVIKLPNLSKGLERVGPSKTRAEVDAMRRELMETAGPVLTRAGQMVGTIARVLQDVSGYLDEGYGPTFTAWRCDECHNLVTDDQLENGWDTGSTMNAVYKPVGEGHATRHLLAYVECMEGDTEHGPMRHVLCRVTPEDPDHIDRVASPAATEEVQRG